MRFRFFNLLKFSKFFCPTRDPPGFTLLGGVRKGDRAGVLVLENIKRLP